MKSYDGYDGSPTIEEITNGFVKHMDLTIPQTFNKTYDWVISISIGECIPRSLEHIYIENVVKAAKEGLVISWGYKLNPEYKFSNEKSPEEVTDLITQHGFKLHKDWSLMLRISSAIAWYRRGLLVFFRQGYPQIEGRAHTSEL